MRALFKRNIILLLLSVVAVCVICACLLTGGGISADAATDGGNSFSTATALTLKNNPSGGEGAMRASVNDAISNSSDIADWYKVTLPSDGYVTFSFSGTATRSNGWRVNFYSNNASDDLIYNGWKISSKESKTTERIGLSAGTYHIKVTKADNSSYYGNDYTVTLDFMPAANWETEFNDTPKDADKIEIGTEYYGTSSIHHISDYDYYVFEMDEDGCFYINFTNLTEPGTGYGWSIYVYDGNLAQFGGSWKAEVNTPTSTGKYAVPAGKYYVRVSGSSTTAPAYKFTVNTCAVPDNYETEGNDKAETANAVRVNEQFFAASGSFDSVDWFVFTIEENGYLSVSFIHKQLQTAADVWRVTLYNSDGLTPISAPTYTVGVECDYSGYSHKVTGMENLQTCNYGVGVGSYYLCVETLVGSSEDYNFTVNFTPSDEWERENNNDISDATDISVGNEVFGSVTHISDKDFYRFYIPEAGVFSVSLSYGSAFASAVWEMNVYRGDYTFIGASHTWTADGGVGLTTARYGVEKGFYAVRVGQGKQGVNSKVDYAVKVSFEPTAEWETENNNTPENADYLPLSTKINACVNGAGDSDCFTFTVEMDTSVSLTLNKTAQSGEGWGTITLLKGTEQLQSTEVSCAEGSIVTEHFEVKAGTYCYKITGTNGDGCEYSVTVSEKHEHSGEWQTVTAPTCTKDGEESRICAICGKPDVRPIPATGHSFGEYELEKKSGIFKKGVESRTCSVCGEEEKRSTDSKPWILAIIIGGAVVVGVGLFNYVKMLKNK